MKVLGFMFLLLGLALLGLTGYFYFQQHNTELSPLPEENGVKVIFVSPTP